MLKVTVRLIALIFISSAPTVVSPQTFSFEQVFQTRLRQEGLLHDKPDGVFGPKTEKAIQDYAKKYNIDQDYEEIVKHMVRWPFEKQIELTDAMKEAAFQRVKFGLWDPDSVKVSITSSYQIPAAGSGSPPSVAVCGEYNEKAKHGGYVGYQKFQVLVPILFSKTTGATALLLESDGAEAFCVLGTSFLAFRN